MNIKIIANEIRQIIERGINSGSVVRKTWVIQSIMAKHSDIDGDDADFALVCCYEAISRIVRAEIGKTRATEKSAGQTLLNFGEGYDKLQKAYLVDRDGEQCAVPIQHLTPSETSKKADEIRRMGDGCYRHAKQLDQFNVERSAIFGAAGIHLPTPKEHN